MMDCLKRKNLSLLLVLSIVCASQASASGFNPFLGKSTVRVENRLKKPSGGPSENLLAGQLPLPPLPGTSSSLPGPPPPLVGVPQPNETWQVVGMINGQVTLMGSSGQMSIVENGSGKDGCVIDYPNIVCNAGDIVHLLLKKKGASVKPLEIVRTENPGRIGKSSQNTVGTQTSSSEIPESEKEVRIHKPEEWEGLDAHASQKEILAGTETTGVIDAVLQRKIEKMGEEISTTRNEKEQLFKVNQLISAEKEQLRISLENTKNLQEQPPAWFSGIVSEYQDPRLGPFGLGGEEKEVFFRISSDVEPTADTLFGRNVFRKEKKGNYVYYAIDRRAVNIGGI